MNIILVVLYFIFAVSGSTLMKYGGFEHLRTLFIVPFVELNISLITLFGFLSYGISFLLYVVILNRFELSFITPIATGIIYTLLMITSVIIFKEHFSFLKIIGSILVISGILLMAIDKTN